MTTPLAERTRSTAPLHAAPARLPVQAAGQDQGPRLEPVPQWEPPFDTEPWDGPTAPLLSDPPHRTLALHPASTAGTAHTATICPAPPRVSFRHWPQLGTALPVARGNHAAPLRGAHLANPVYSASGEVAHHEEYPDLVPAGVAESRQPPAAIDAATVLARALVEVLAGRRPRAQIRAHCVDAVFDGLQHFPRLGPGPSLASLWVCEAAEGHAEVSASFRCGGVTRPLAMHLRAAGGAWIVTALQIA